MRIVLDVLLLILLVLFAADLVRNIVMFFKLLAARKRRGQTEKND